MFAFVVWDAKGNSWRSPPVTASASSRSTSSPPRRRRIRLRDQAVAGLPGFRRRLNLARAYDFLSAGIMDHTEETLFDGVRQLHGGECVRLDLRTGDRAKRCRCAAGIDLEPGTLEMSEGEAARALPRSACAIGAAAPALRCSRRHLPLRRARQLLDRLLMARELDEAETVRECTPSAPATT